MLSYNHERFIAQALDSALAQAVDFPYEIVIGDDGSKDNSQSIIQSYSQRFPDFFVTILHKQNIGMQPNFLSVLKKCRGKYIALLEGDDYWLSPHKLQQQFEFMETHPNYGGCCHNVLVRNECNNSLSPLHPPSFLADGTDITFDRMLSSNPIPTCSLFFKATVISNLPNWMINAPVGDWPLNLTISQTGHIYYTDQLHGVYRVHGSNFWAKMHHSEVEELAHETKQRNACITVQLAIANQLKGPQLQTVHKSVAQSLCILARRNFRLGRFHDSRLLAFKALRFAPLTGNEYSIRECISLILRSSLPVLRKGRKGNPD